MRRYEQPVLHVVGEREISLIGRQPVRSQNVRPSGQRRNAGSSGRSVPGRRSASGRQPELGMIQPRAALTPQQRRRERRRRERLRKAKIRRRIVFALWQVIFVSAIVMLFLKVKSGIKNSDPSLPATEPAAAQNPGLADAGTGEDAGEPSFWKKLTGGWSGSGEQTYADYCGLDEVDKPVKREPEEVQIRLAELAKEYDRIAEICANQGAYPDKMLEALANNPEMADFVAGYPTASKEASGGLTEIEQRQEHPLFLQWDPRWGYVSYGDDSNIGLAGCGPVSLSMALYYLTDDTSLTPDVLATYAMNNGYYMAGTGTAWALMTDVPGRYGVNVTQPGIEESRMKYELDQGRVIICAMRAGDFTAAGHFIVIYGYDKDGFLINDPNCVARSRRSWPYDQIQWQIKQLWSLGTGQSGYGTPGPTVSEPGGQSGTDGSGLWTDGDSGLDVEEWFEENGSVVFRVAE